jgi:hypothetical protein
MRRLYSFPELPTDAAQHLESKFLQLVDSDAAKALKQHLEMSPPMAVPLQTPSSAGGYWLQAALARRCGRRQLPLERGRRDAIALHRAEPVMRRPGMTNDTVALRASWRALAAQHGRHREKPLRAVALVVVVVDEFERAVAQFQYRNVGRRADIERAPIVEGLECARRIDGRAGDHLAERHAKHQELRHYVREVDDAWIAA